VYRAADDLQTKKGTWFSNVRLNNEVVCVMLYQIRMIDKKRLSVKIGELSLSDLNKVKEKLKILLELP